MSDGPKLVPITSGRRRPQFHRLDALPARPHREENVQGLFAAGELVALIGRPGVGKTAVLANLAIAVAEGRPFLNRAVIPGAVVYIAAEKAEEAKRRLLAIRRRASAPVYITTTRPNLANPLEVDALATEIEKICDVERRCPSLILFDTLARSMTGLDEDRAADAAKVIEALATIAERIPTATILFTHHLSRKGGTLRGSTAFEGAVDLVLKVERDNRRQNGRLEVVKANAIDEGQRLPFRLAIREYRETPDSDPEPVITAEAIENATPDRHGQRGLSDRAQLLLTQLQVSGPIHRDVARQTFRNALGPEKNANTARMAFNRCLDELITAKSASVQSDLITPCTP